jgi:MFS family permease
MYTAASSWLMTSLSPDPLIVSLVQVAASLPIVLLAIPAGALADIIDRRRFLIIGEAANTAIAAVFAVLVSLDLVTAAVLLLFTFLISAFGAFTAPAWQAVTPQLVPKEDLPAAIAANSIGFNLSRAIGPALGGAFAAAFGIASPFWINAASNLGVNGGLIWWHPPRQRTTRLPAERFARAIRTGLRYVASALLPHRPTPANTRNHANHAQTGHCGLRSGNLGTKRPSSRIPWAPGCVLNSLDSCNRSASGALELVLVETPPNGFNLGGKNALDQARC